MDSKIFTPVIDKGKTMVILITNTIVPYCYDIAHVLGLPTNFSHRFRYRSRWIEHPDRIMSLRGQHGLIILRNFYTGDLLPVRFISVEDIFKAGDINYIEFRVLDHFPISEKTSVTKAIMQVLRERGFENSQSSSLKCLVFEMSSKLLGTYAKEQEQNYLERWSGLLQEIGKLESYKDFAFLKILRLRDSGGVAAVVGKNQTGKFSYKLRPERMYYLEVMQQTPYKIDETERIESPYDVELKAEADEVTILRKVQRVVGKYDLLRFIFKTPSVYVSKHTFIEIESKQGGEISKFGLPALFLPLVIEPSGWLRFARWGKVLLGVAAGVTFLTSYFLPSSLQVHADLIRSISLFLLILTSQKWDDLVKDFAKAFKHLKLP